jgi:peptidoglycan/LPS O-acetylase OafA/YrhL
MEDIDQRGFVFSLWRYAVRRLLRIMPAYLVFLGGLWSFSLMEAKVAVDHALLLRGDDHLWTIPVEMKFYFVLPIVVGMLLTLPCRPVVAAAIAVGSLAVYYLAGPDRISENSTELSHYLPFFAAGTVLALVPEFRGQQVLGWLGIAAFFVLTPRAIAWVFDISVSQALEWSWLFALSWGAVILGSRTGSLNVVFSLRPLLFLGEISFSLYLLHYFVIRQLPPMQV